MITRTHKSIAHFGLIASVNIVRPHTDPLYIVVGETGWTLVAGRLTVPARVEDATIGRVGEDAVQSGTVGRAYWGLCIQGGQKNSRKFTN